MTPKRAKSQPQTRKYWFVVNAELGVPVTTAFSSRADACRWRVKFLRLPGDYRIEQWTPVRSEKCDTSGAGA